MRHGSDFPNDSTNMLYSEKLLGNLKFYEKHKKE